MSKIRSHPCKACELNKKENCGASWCHTREINNWAVDCRNCGFINLVPWKKVFKGCPTCASNKVSIYHMTTLDKEK